MKLETNFNIGDIIWTCEWNNMTRTYICMSRVIVAIHIKVLKDKTYFNYIDKNGRPYDESLCFKTEEEATEETNRRNKQLVKGV